MSKLRATIATVWIVAVAGAIGAAGTMSAFSTSTANPGNTFSAGTVTMTDDDAGAAVVSLANARPGDSSSGYIRATYGGTLDAGVRLYANVTGSLAQYLTLTVTRGTGAAGFPSCGSFTPDATDYLGQGNGVIYSGTLASFPGSFAAGIEDPRPSSPETWSASEAHSYRFTVTLQNDPAAQGLNSGATFVWEARNQ